MHYHTLSSAVRIFARAQDARPTPRTADDRQTVISMKHKARNTNDRTERRHPWEERWVWVLLKLCCDRPSWECRPPGTLLVDKTHHCKHRQMNDEQKERQFAEFRDAFIRDLPSEHKDRWGEVVFGEFGKTHYPILLLNPFDVPPVIREKWFEKYKRVRRASLTAVLSPFGGWIDSSFCPKSVLTKFSSSQLKLKDQLSRLPYVGYFYGQSGEDTCYSIFSTKRLVDYKTGLEDDKLTKSSSIGPKAMADVEEELEKDPKDRGRGIVAFLEDFKIPSFGLSHDLITSSTLDSVPPTDDATNKAEDEDLPDVRAPAKILRSFGRYHIIQTKIHHGKTGGLTLNASKTPRGLSRALKSVFTSVSKELWYFELGSDVPHGIDSGDVFITREDGQWHLGTPSDFREILRNLDCTVYLLRRSLQQRIEEEAEEDEKERIKRGRTLQRAGEEKRPAKRGRPRKIKEEEGRGEEKRPAKREIPRKIKEEGHQKEDEQHSKCGKLSADASERPSVVPAPDAVVRQPLEPALGTGSVQGLAPAPNAVDRQSTSAHHAIRRSLHLCHVAMYTNPTPTPFQNLKKGHLKPSADEYRACATERARKGLVSWYKRHNELVDFREEYGHCNVPQMYKPNLSLGIW
eukprot:scaffold2219_cov177-Amphora_coffeaeformis.AAC.7